MRPRLAAGLLGLALASTACAAPAPNASSGDEPPTPAEAGFGTEVWRVVGTTAERGLYDTHYFNDPGASRLAPGPTNLAWTCSGAGQLEVVLVRVGRPGPVAPELTAAAPALVVPCPTLGDAASVRAFPFAAAGGEDAVVIRPAIEPQGAIAYTVVILQGG